MTAEKTRDPYPFEKSFDQKSLEFDQRQYMKNNTILLGIHVLLIIPYLFLSPKHMTVVNIFSILFYVLGFGLLKKSRRFIVIYSYMILAEILLHDIFCVLIFGWKCGFQLWIISLVCTYIKDYITPERSEHERNVYAAIIVITGFLTFTALYLITEYVNIPIQDPPSDKVTTAFVLMNAFITFSGIVAFTGIYTRQMEYKYTELHQQADFDQLTGLGNRYYMNDLLREEEKNSDSVSGYSVAMIDIDHFKAVNDTYGHHNGDIVLKDIADIMSEILPVNVSPGRWGGEEFLIVSDRDITYPEFQAILEDLRNRVSSHIFILENNVNIHCTISIGAAGYEEGHSIQEIIKKADDNLYEAKRTGRNRLVA
ncbi:MAG: GGDEF domain-containing protein [Lachnospiraceae bacterium]|nr:GGDEF domain-containing protein [Lachnospiraceae bacterium]